MRCAVTVVVLCAGISAQSTPRSCPADRPVDDIIAEIDKQQSKKKHRDANPLPQGVCIFGWCLERSRHSSTTSEPASRAKASPQDNENSKEDCDEAMGLAVQAAHNIEVGDYYFERSNYNGALVRYTDALEGKPADSAIHVRLGRVLEKLNRLSPAIEHYMEAQKLGGPERWSNEAKSALSRLQLPPGS